MRCAQDKIINLPCENFFVLRTKLCHCSEAYQSLLCCTAFKFRFGFKRLAAIACDHALPLFLLCLLWEGGHDTFIFQITGHNLEFFLIGPDTMYLVACVAGIKKRGGGREKCKRETPIPQSPNPPIPHPLSLSPIPTPFDACYAGYASGTVLF